MTMRNNPLVSILIPSYNRADFLGFAIDSALAQTYQNIEIIVHDDASTDKTPDLLKKYKRIERVRVITTKTNHGMIGGWNYLVRFAKGEYLKFLASDDLLDPECIAVLVEAAQKNMGCALITCKRRFVNNKNEVITTLGFSTRSLVTSGPKLAHQILTDLRINKIGEPSAVLYPSSLIKKAGDYDSQFSQFADFEYWLRLLQFGDLVYVNRPLCSFRLHDSSNTSRSIRDGRFVDEIFLLIDKYYSSLLYRQAFHLTKADQARVTRQKTLDTLKNIKDLFLHGHVTQARNYFRRLSSHVHLDYMTRLTLSHILK